MTQKTILPLTDRQLVEAYGVERGCDDLEQRRDHLPEGHRLGLLGWQHQHDAIRSLRCVFGR